MRLSFTLRRAKEEDETEYWRIRRARFGQEIQTGRVGDVVFSESSPRKRGAPVRCLSDALAIPEINLLPARVCARGTYSGT